MCEIHHWGISIWRGLSIHLKASALDMFWKWIVLNKTIDRGLNYCFSTSRISNDNDENVQDVPTSPWVGAKDNSVALFRLLFSYK
ncbi:uncharacterized protein VTP21DRAFT_6997 [Calcarisporiella thermophila]|uniref:uncharacterized protein n=1 Tax=Calcarisporiella thermophila TaxID=911321 RepID=UPI003744AF8E